MFVFFLSFLFVLPTPSSPPSRGVARVIWLRILWHRTVCFCLIIFVMHVILFSLCYAFSAGHFPPSRDCGLCHISISCWFAFSSRPRHDGGPREGFDVGFPCHSACVFLQFACLVLRPPPPTLAARRRFLTVVCLIVSAFPSITFLRVFPGFIAKPFRGVGVGFEEPHLRLMF